MEMLRLRPSVSQSTPARQPEAQCEGRRAGLWGLRRGRPWVCALALRGTQPRPALFQVAEMRRTLTPANSPVSSPSKHGDRFIPSRAGANWSVNFHRINVRAAGGPRAGRQPPVGRAGHPSCPSALPVPQENEKSPSQNRKAKDATSDSGKGQQSGPGRPVPRPRRPRPAQAPPPQAQAPPPRASPAQAPPPPAPPAQATSHPQTAWPTRPC